MEILQLIGTCSNNEIGEFAERNGRKSSWNNAKKTNYKQQITTVIKLN